MMSTGAWIYTSFFLSFLRLLVVVIKNITAQQSLGERVGNMI